MVGDGREVGSYSAEFQRRRRRRPRGGGPAAASSSSSSSSSLAASLAASWHDADRALPAGGQSAAARALVSRVQRRRTAAREGGALPGGQAERASPARVWTPVPARLRTSFRDAWSAPKGGLRGRGGGEDLLDSTDDDDGSSARWPFSGRGDRRFLEEGRGHEPDLREDASDVALRWGGSRSSGRRDRPASPPPPPPPPPPPSSDPRPSPARIAAYPAPNNPSRRSWHLSSARRNQQQLKQQQQQQQRRHKQAVPSAQSTRSYAASIAAGATSHRRASAERSGTALVDRIAVLEQSVEHHRANEQKLQNVNTRLQDRLVVFQKQNHANVALAKQRIGDLEQRLRIKQTQLASATPRSRSRRRDPGGAHGAGHELVPVQARAQVPGDHAAVLRERSLRQQEALAEWKRASKLAEFRAWRVGRRARETKVRVLRAWACAVLLRKIQSQARLRRTVRCARRCLKGWRQQTELHLLERMRLEWARDYFACVVQPRRCLRAWRQVASDAAAERRRSALGAVLPAWHRAAADRRRDRLVRFFGRWRLFYARLLKERMERYEARYLLMPTSRGVNKYGGLAATRAGREKVSSYR